MHQGRYREQASLMGFLWRARFTALLALFLLVIAPSLAAGLVSFDFETPFLVHPGRQVWDFCLVRHDGQYNAFYHTIDPLIQHPAVADTIWHAVSNDLRRWEIRGPAVTSGPDWWDEVAIWAPDVIFDEQTGRWAMLYTGVAEGMVQRACLAWSDDLQTWDKSQANPVFEPDSLTYFWGPNQAWSSFRDPFLYFDGQAWNMLSTAHLRLEGVPAGRRAIVHRSVSTDLENWQDAGVFFAHDGTVGQNRDFESVQYLVRDGWHHLFFTEQDPTIQHHPTSHMMATDPSGWTMANRTIVDSGWAPEIKPFTNRPDTEIFARLAKGQDPRDGSWFVTAKFDSVRFGPGGQAPMVIAADLLGPDWTTRSGESGTAAPTFGENPTWRGAAEIQIEGHGWFGSREHYGGPLSGTGQPGGMVGDTATGRLESRPFVLIGDYFRLQLAGGHFPLSCYVGLKDESTGEILTRINPRGENVLTLKLWDVREFQGQTVRMILVDEESGTGGWIAVDDIQEFSDTSPVQDSGYRAGGEIPALPVTGLVAQPNPFNSGTTVRFDVERNGIVRLEIYDVGGRRVWYSEEIDTTTGPIRIPWDGRDQAGRNLPSGAYFCRVLHEGSMTAGVRLMLVK